MMWYLSKIRGLDDLRDRDDLVLGAEVNTLLKSRNIKIYIKYNIMAANPEKGGFSRILDYIFSQQIQ